MAPTFRHALLVAAAFATALTSGLVAADQSDAGFWRSFEILEQVAGAADSRPSASSIPSGTASMLGQVVDASSGLAVPGVVVTLRLPAAAPMRVLADTQGRFALLNLPAGSFNIDASRRGYMDGAHGKVRPDGPSFPLSLEAGAQANVKIPMWKFGAISGRVVDETGEPVVGVPIRVLRRSTATGRPTIGMGGTDHTDDRGMYRVGTLTPGDYLVSVAMSQQATVMMGGPGVTGRIVGPGGGDMVAFNIDRDGSAIAGPGGASLSYPTIFFPSVTSAARATVIPVASGQERAGIDLRLEPAPIRRISGILTAPDGTAGRMGITLVPADGDGMGSFLMTSLTLTDPSGAFTFPSVHPGEYVLRVSGAPRMTGNTVFQPMASSNGPIAVERSVIMVVPRGGEGGVHPPPPPPPPRPSPGGQNLWAEMRISVGATDISGLNVALRPGLKVTGSVEWSGGVDRPSADALSRITVSLEPTVADMPSFVRERVQPDGTFATGRLVPGHYSVRAAGAPAGWYFRGAFVNGRDVTDAPLSLTSGDIDGVTLLFTNRETDLGGTVSDASGTNDGAIAVIVFPVERDTWTTAGANARRFRHVRTRASDTFALRGLPPGRYHVIAVPDTETGEWRNPSVLETFAGRAEVVDLAEGQPMTQSLRVVR